LKLGVILNMSSGAPLNITGRNTLYQTGTPDIVGDFPREGQVVWPLQETDIFGYFFGQKYSVIRDPACATLPIQPTNFAQWCMNTAVADANGNIVLRNAAPGELGSLGLRTIEGPGRWDLDTNVQKSIRLTESKNLTFRVDASNVFNHPTPGNPELSINSTSFGQISTKTGSRTLQAQIRLEF
jgi:hypothetical protein